jgi:uncharacterized protein (TIGR00251 family)
MNIQQSKNGVLIDALVKPNSPVFRIFLEDEKVVIMCVEAPIKSKVNKEIVRELTRLFHRRVHILSGASSKQKKLLVEGATELEVKQTLSSK